MEGSVTTVLYCWSRISLIKSVGHEMRAESTELETRVGFMEHVPQALLDCFASPTKEYFDFHFGSF